MGTDATGSQKVAIITGGNSGVGCECARNVAVAGWHVVLACRNADTAAVATQMLVRETGNAAVETMPLDLASFDSIRRFAHGFLERELPLHALVCNAGIQVVRGLTFSRDGYETTFAVNHLGHFLLTHLLLERLLRSAPARIVVVSSGVHDPQMRTGMPKPSYTDFDSLSMRGAGTAAAYNGRLAYVNSKLCNLLFAYELWRRLEAQNLTSAEKPLTVNAFEPGLVPGSGLARDYNPAARFVWNRILPLLAGWLRTVNSPGQAGLALARIVLDPRLETVSGKYFASHTRFQPTASSAASYDREAARALWDTSVALSGVRPEESPLMRDVGRCSLPSPTGC